MTAPAVTAPPPITQPAQPAIPPVSPERRADDFINRMVMQHGTLESAMRAAALRSITAEDSLAAANTQLAAYQQRLPEGSLVLSKEAAVSFAKLQALNLTPEQIVERVTKATTLEGSVAQTELESLARANAAVFGLDPDGLAAHVVAKGLHAELRDATVTEASGKQVVKKVLHVRPKADATAPLKLVSEYVATLPAYDQRALKPGTTTGAPTAPVAGVPHPVQTIDVPAGGGGDEVSKFKDQVAADRASRPNPLLPPRQPATPAAGQSAQ